jgi:thiol:disulfide interchange protein DsbC
LKNKLYSLLIAISVAGIVQADSSTEAVRKTLSNLFPSEIVESIRPTPMAGLIEVDLGGELVYVSKDGRYLLQGELIDLVGRENLTQTAKAEMRKKEFQKLDKNLLITFGDAENEGVNSLYIYTDIDCGYCRKLHKEVPALTGAGLTVHYLAYPRMGLKSVSYDKAVNVWCAQNKQKALTQAKLGQTVAIKTCVNPVADHFALGQSMNLAGTPAIYASDGTYLGAYAPAEQLIAATQELRKRQSSIVRGYLD